MKDPFQKMPEALQNIKACLPTVYKRLGNITEQAHRILNKYQKNLAKLAENLQRYNDTLKLNAEFYR